MHAFETIELFQLVTVTGGGDNDGTTFEAEGTLSGKTPIGIEATGQGKVHIGNGKEVALMKETRECIKDLKDRATCLDILKTVTGQPQPQPAAKQ